MSKTEITVQVFDDLDYILNALKAHGFVNCERFELEDYYFSSLKTDVKQEYGWLIKNSFLIRRVISKREKCYLCYKNKLLDSSGNVISEDRVQLPLTDFKTALRIFSLAGLNNWCQLKQVNLGFKKGETTLYLQIVDGLGMFFELEETKSLQNLPIKQKMEAMYSVINQLGIKLGKDYSCKKVYMKYLADLKH